MQGEKEPRETEKSNSGCALQYLDLRDWLARVEEMGDLKVVTGANWHTDVGQVVEIMCHDEGTSSIIFDFHLGQVLRQIHEVFFIVVVG